MTDVVPSWPLDVGTQVVRVPDDWRAPTTAGNALREAAAACGRLRSVSRLFGHPDLLARPQIRLRQKPAAMALSPELRLEIEGAAAVDRLNASARAATWARAARRRASAAGRDVSAGLVLSDQQLCELHLLATRADPSVDLPGAFRQRAISVLTADGSPRQIYSDPGAPLAEAMSNWQRWQRQCVAPPLERAALNQLQFLSIHPFADGNGRMSRMLVLVDLIAGNVLDGLGPDLDAVANSTDDEHRRHLVDACTGGDLCAWVTHVCQSVLVACSHAQSRAERYQTLVARSGDLVSTSYEQRVLQLLLSSIVLTASWVANVTGESELRARVALDHLVSLGALDALPNNAGFGVLSAIRAIDEPLIRAGKTGTPT